MENLRNIMSIRGVNQVELSKLSGLAQTSISQYLAGRHRPLQTQLEKLATALRVTVDELLNGFNEKREKLSIEELDEYTLRFRKLVEKLGVDDPLLYYIDAIIRRELEKPPK